MAIEIIRDDITRLKVDAIVNPANEELEPGGGCCGAIYSAAGVDLIKATAKLGGCKVGEAKITDAFNLPSKWIVHTVGPIWIDGKHNEREKLTSCYLESLRLAYQTGAKSIAFPLISSGIFGYPKAEALRVAWEAISSFLLEYEMDVFITLFDGPAIAVGEKLFADIKQFIDDNYVSELEKKFERSRRRQRAIESLYAMGKLHTMGNCCAKRIEHPPQKIYKKECCTYGAPCEDQSLDDILKETQATFSQLLLKKVYASGLSPAECYTRANITKQHFSKIQSKKNYVPKKQTVAAFALALKLSISETLELMESAGFTLSHSSRFDLIIEYVIKHKIYDILDVNAILYKYDLPLLGA